MIAYMPVKLPPPADTIEARAVALYAARYLPPKWRVDAEQIKGLAAINQTVRARWEACLEDARGMS